MARWGMPGPVLYGGAPVTNIRNLSSPHWRGWLGTRNRCLVPAGALKIVARGRSSSKIALSIGLGTG